MCRTLSLSCDHAGRRRISSPEEIQMRAVRPLILVASLLTGAACADGSPTGPRDAGSRPSRDYGDITQPGGGGLSPECDAARVPWELARLNKPIFDNADYVPGTSPEDVAVGVALTEYQAKCGVNGRSIGP
jgi:hypothetical protein